MESLDPWVVHSEDLIGRVTNVMPAIGILLIEPVRYVIVAVIIISAISLVADIYKKEHPKQTDERAK